MNERDNLYNFFSNEKRTAKLKIVYMNKNRMNNLKKCNRKKSRKFVVVETRQSISHDDGLQTTLTDLVITEELRLSVMKNYLCCDCVIEPCV